MIQREVELKEQEWKQKLKGPLLMMLIYERKACSPFTLLSQKCKHTQKQKRTPKLTQG